MKQILDHEHWWDRWRPQSRTQQHRRCQHPNCAAAEVRDAPKG